MRFVLLTKDEDMANEAREGFHPTDTFEHYTDWEQALERDNKFGKSMRILFFGVLLSLYCACTYLCDTFSQLTTFQISFK
jgi:hypothetical protein